MTKSNKINILQADHVVGLSQAAIEINMGFEILLLGGRALPSINPTPIGQPKFQRSQISILTADLEYAEKNESVFLFLIFQLEGIQKCSQISRNIPFLLISL